MKRVVAGTKTAVECEGSSGKNRTWNCDTCRSEGLQPLKEKLQNSLLHNDELTQKNKKTL